MHIFALREASVDKSFSSGGKVDAKPPNWIDALTVGALSVLVLSMMQHFNEMGFGSLEGHILDAESFLEQDSVGAWMKMLFLRH